MHSQLTCFSCEQLLVFAIVAAAGIQASPEKNVSFTANSCIVCTCVCVYGDFLRAHACWYLCFSSRMRCVLRCFSDYELCSLQSFLKKALWRDSRTGRSSISSLHTTGESYADSVDACRECAGMRLVTFGQSEQDMRACVRACMCKIRA